MKHGMNKFQGIGILLPINFNNNDEGKSVKMELSKGINSKEKNYKDYITSNNFRYSTTETFATFLICPRYEKLIPQCDHLLKGCEYWKKNRTIFSPKAS